MMTVEKELTTPFGIALHIILLNKELEKRQWWQMVLTYAANTLMKIKMVLGSVKPFIACDLSKDLFFMPVWFPETRFTAINRSRWLKNLALDGASGSKNQIPKAHRHVAPPSCKGRLSSNAPLVVLVLTHDVKDELPSLWCEVLREL